jgi:preprotein translocase subunit Sec63
LSYEVINTAYNSLRDSKKILENQLDYGIPHGKVSINRKEIIQNQLADVNNALSTFEELMEAIGW